MWDRGVQGGTDCVLCPLAVQQPSCHPWPSAPSPSARGFKKALHTECTGPSPRASQGLLLASVPLHMLSHTPCLPESFCSAQLPLPLGCFPGSSIRWEEALIFLRGWAVS